ncbi:hypothetical protein SEUCBS140593_010420 [Sporothrix eucalyptigena]|uniref:Uncharacterized protein n=1 Tax=Sporothrix eucalyptigena TaxID=1812306 RepID=A0ABP0D1A7_9PEZI
MAPIPIYSQSPISAAKPSGVTPKTEGVAQNQNEGRAAQETPTKTRPLAAGAVPPPPQPGAAPSLPQPTGASQNPYAPPAPATTAPVTNTRTSSYSPAPPQPGAAPVPPVTAGASPHYQQSPPPATTTATAVLPPPPRNGETLASTGIFNAPAAPPTTAMPTQMGMPPLSRSPYPASARGTSTATQPGYPGIPQPTGLAQGLAMGEQQQTSLDHPPGYVQNAYAAEMTSSQREAAQLANSGLSSYHIDRNSAIDSRSYSSGATFDDDESESIWNAAKKLASNAGERLSAAETEVWKYINKQ